MKIAIVACLHGTEPFGIKVISKLKKLYLKELGFFIVNRKALEQKKRFIDIDMNRCFPGDSNSKKYEERIARKLLTDLYNYDYIIDIHSSSSNTPPIAIITKKTRENIDLAIKTGIKKICFMSSEFASGKSLIDHVKKGISLEVGNHDDPTLVKKTYDLICNLLINLRLTNGSKTKNNPEFYEIIGLEKSMNLKLKDFEKYHNYYPVLVDETSYTNIKCLKAKKINL